MYLQTTLARMKCTLGAAWRNYWMLGLLLFLCSCTSVRVVEETKALANPLTSLLDTIPPLAHAQKNRPPLFIWTSELSTNASDAQIETTLLALQARGLSLFLRWQPNLSNTVVNVRRMAAIQRKLGMPVAVAANPICHGLSTKGNQSAHLDVNGKPLRGSGLSWNPVCPFSPHPMNAEMGRKFDAYAKAHKAIGAPLDYLVLDWELDGPNEWKQSWAVAQKCVNCRTQIPDIATNFAAYQAVVRKLRSEMQRESFVKPVLAHFPVARLGNYAMNPHDGYRYYWDYYEEDTFGKPNLTEGISYRREQGAYYRPWWRMEFETSGYTMAMPVIYAWYHLFLNYDFANTDYRWFYGMLREGTSAARNTPVDTPLIPFVHWMPIGAPDKPEQQPAGFAPLSEKMYQELLWHLLLRGVDSFLLWAPGDEARELRPLHAVYAESLAYPEFFEKGTPVTFDLPDKPGAVVSAMKWKEKLLVRRTDFAEPEAPVTLTVDGKQIVVPAAAGKCQVLVVQNSEFRIQ